jgi:hypothetical protein
MSACLLTSDIRDPGLAHHTAATAWYPFLQPPIPPAHRTPAFFYKNLSAILPKKTTKTPKQLLRGVQSANQTAQCGLISNHRDLRDSERFNHNSAIVDAVSPPRSPRIRKRGEDTASTFNYKEKPADGSLGNLALPAYPSDLPTFDLLTLDIRC